MRPTFNLLLLPTLVYAWTWPNPQLEQLDKQRFDRSGYNEGFLAGGVTPCTSFLGGSTAARANAADWIRTAYHDMATHNVVDGTGGLDASIRLEQDRPENAGDGFQFTLLVLTGVASRYVSVADILALGAVTAYEQCGGPQIPFRGGRIDAIEPNAPGVPEPQQGLDSHTAAFARQGFTKEEMIGLVACGHTFGGVQNEAFPDIVPPSTDPNNTSGNARFDSTFVTFDTSVVTEYLDGTTANPLVVGHNATTNSDGRIFGSDGNVTMKALSHPEVYASTCATLIARMLDTVPRGVELTEVFEPLPAKPEHVQLVWMGDGTIKLIGEVRFWDMQENDNREITIKWTDRSGNGCADCSALLGHTIDQVSTYLPGPHTSLWYSLNRTSTEFIRFNQTSSTSKFWFEIDEGHGHKTVEDQNGLGFVLQDVVMIANSSCDVDHRNLDIAIRKDKSPTRVYVEADDFGSNGLPFTHIYDVPAPTNSSSTAGDEYVIWSVQITDSLFRGWNIAADIDGQKFITSGLESYRFPTCT